MLMKVKVLTPPPPPPERVYITNYFNVPRVQLHILFFSEMHSEE